MLTFMYCLAEYLDPVLPGKILLLLSLCHLATVGVSSGFLAPCIISPHLIGDSCKTTQENPSPSQPTGPIEYVMPSVQ